MSVKHHLFTLAQPHPKDSSYKVSVQRSPRAREPHCHGNEITFGEDGYSYNTQKAGEQAAEGSQKEQCCKLEPNVTVDLTIGRFKS